MAVNDNVQQTSAGKIVGVRTVKIVAVKDDLPRHTNGEWAVYYGDPEWDDVMVAERGHKMPYDAALRLFPHVNGRYRD